MARTSKKVATTEETIAEIPVQSEEVANKEKKEEVDTTEETIAEIPANVEKLMKLTPQYESFYVTSKGFVHPIGAPEYLIKDAVLYKNKYYKQ